MEGLFGSDITVSQNAAAVKSAGRNTLNFPNSPSASLHGNDAYLKVGRGRGPSGITLDFGANPINSFNVDWCIFKGGKSFTILADGVVIDQHTLSKAQRKSGLTGHQDTYDFDTPVHKLEFIGLKKKYPQYLISKGGKNRDSRITSNLRRLSRICSDLPASSLHPPTQAEITSNKLGG